MQQQPYHRWRVATFTLSVVIGSLVVAMFLLMVLLALVGVLSAPSA